jgi:hypothetical protein
MTNAGQSLYYYGSTAITLTFANTITGGFTCTVCQMSTGQISCVGQSATINNEFGYTKTARQYSTLGIVAPANNTFVMTGSGAP